MVLVLNIPFWNAHLLAHEVATVDVLTGGPLELVRRRSLNGSGGAGDHRHVAEIVAQL